MLLDASEKDNHSLSVQDIREEVDTFMFEVSNRFGFKNFDESIFDLKLKLSIK